jgi:hypothetical protein
MDLRAEGVPVELGQVEQVGFDDPHGRGDRRYAQQGVEGGVGDRAAADDIHVAERGRAVYLVLAEVQFDVPIRLHMPSPITGNRASQVLRDAGHSRTQAFRGGRGRGCHRPGRPGAAPRRAGPGPVNCRGPFRDP